ncbi:MAG TPA: GNAT family N-acetyltransferase [Mycobacteriales bacterium]|nr:GNAT family N-acetyltransferase [Mycobacteriales bacterium]
MRAVRMADEQAFADRAGTWLRRDPVVHTIVCSAVALAQRHPERFVDPLWLIVEDDAGALAGAAIHTPPFPLAVLPMPDDALAALAALVRTERPDLGGVTGPAPCGERFAGLWREATGAGVRVAMALRLFRLDEVSPPAGVPGQLRTDPGLAADAAELTDWVRAFVPEATGEPARDPELVVERLIERGGLCVWYDRDRPVSFASRTVPAYGVLRLGLVYTPPELRGQGYASACVAAVSQQALDGGITPILFTDLANPTSNKIYQRLGYRPVVDAYEHAFSYG